MICHVVTTSGYPVSVRGLSITPTIDDGLVRLTVSDSTDDDPGILQQFAQFHRQFPQVLDEFIAECRHRIAQKRPARAREVLGHVRRERCFKYGPGRIALRNEFSSFYGALARNEGLHVPTDTDIQDVQRALADTGIQTCQ